MKRLNFAHKLAEEPSMKRVDALLILIIFVVGFLCLAYWHTATSQNYIENNPKALAEYNRRLELKALKTEISKIKTNQKRSVSRDVASVEIESDLTQIPSALDTTVAARKQYSEIREVCFDPSREMDCLNKIDLIITQFPETVWAAESLIILTEIYRRNSRNMEADDVIKIIKHEFKSYPNVQSKVELLESRSL